MDTTTVALFTQDFPAWLTAHGVPYTSGVDLDVLQAGIRQLAGAWLAQLNAAYRGTAETPFCRVCGCTEDRACPGGCCWVPDPRMLGDLCSTCAHLLHQNGMLTDPLDVLLDPFGALGQMAAAGLVPDVAGFDLDDEPDPA